MSPFGRKRYWERQRLTCEQQHRAGYNFGVYLFQTDCPRPGFVPCRDDPELSFRLGVQAGYTAAELEFEDEIGWFLREEAERGLVEIDHFLAKAEGR